MSEEVIKKDRVVTGEPVLLKTELPQASSPQKTDPPQPSSPPSPQKLVETTPVEPAIKKELPRKEIKHNKKTLPNCKITGIDYRVSLEKEITGGFAPGEIERIAAPSIDSSAKFSINWDKDKYELSCHPDQAGEFEITVLVDTNKGERHFFPFNLVVNPDPKTLWKNIPSRQDGVYAKPDCDKFFLPCGSNLSIVAASQRGRSHAQEGKPRDDDFIAHWDAVDSYAILVVADGAGSAKFSRKGSQIAVQTVLEKAKAAFNHEFWVKMRPYIMKYHGDGDAQARKNIEISLYKVLVEAAWEAKMRIRKEAEEREEQFYAEYKKREKFTARDFATTLIVTIVKKVNSIDWFIATFWIGDGGMGVFYEDAGKVIVQGTPDGGEYGGQTRFLTDDNPEVWPQGNDAGTKITERRIRFDVVTVPDAVILMTDGITDPKFETDSNLISFAKWNELWTELKKEVPFDKRDNSVAYALLKWMDFWAVGNHDDRTMIVMY